MSPNAKPVPTASASAEADPETGSAVGGPASAASWFGRQRAAFGLPFLVCICTVYFAQGFRSLPSLSIQFFLKETMVLEPADVQSLLSMAALPWSFKPIYGLISDSFPIRRQRRKPYLVAAAVLGVGAWVGLSWLANDSVGGKATPLLLGLLLLSNLSTALSDVIVDAMVAERAAAAARHATLDGADASAGTEGENALQALCWGSLAVGGLAGSGLGMVAASSVSVSRVFLLTAACPLLVLLASRALSETPLPVGKAGSSGLSALRHQLSLLAAALRSPSIFKPLLFFLAQSAIVPDLSQAFFFFSTDVLLFTKEVRGGPSPIAAAHRPSRRPARDVSRAH